MPSSLFLCLPQNCRSCILEKDRCKGGKRKRLLWVMYHAREEQKWGSR